MVDFCDQIKSIYITKGKRWILFPLDQGLDEFQSLVEQETRQKQKECKNILFQTMANFWQTEAEDGAFKEDPGVIIDMKCLINSGIKLHYPYVTFRQMQLE